MTWKTCLKNVAYEVRKLQPDILRLFRMTKWAYEMSGDAAKTDSLLFTPVYIYKVKILEFEASQ